MASHLVTVFVPHAVAEPRGVARAAAAASWVLPKSSLRQSARTTPRSTARAAATAPTARVWQWARRRLQQLSAQREPQTAQELLAYARSIEQAMPNHAAELRYLAAQQPDADRYTPRAT